MERKPFDPKEMIQILESGRQIRMNTPAGGVAIISLLRAGDARGVFSANVSDDVTPKEKEELIVILKSLLVAGNYDEVDGEWKIGTRQECGEFIRKFLGGGRG